MSAARCSVCCSPKPRSERYHPRVSDTILESTELFFQEQPSDKVYNVRLLETAKGFTVAVEWGRRGAKLSTGTKAVEVPRDKAQKAYDKVIKQKLRKGYEQRTKVNQPAAVAPDQGQGSASKAGVFARAKVGVAAQLLNNADPSALEAYFTDPELIAQQKLDGMRLVVHVRADGVLTTNRNGQASVVSEVIEAAVRAVPAGTILDGELVASPLTYWIFDLLAWAGEELQSLSYAERYARLSGHAAQLCAAEELVIVPAAESEADKRKLHATLQEQQAEGIVFKQRSAPYVSGRPPSGGSQLKLKFVKTADVFITANTGNAYQMVVHDEQGAPREVGKVFAGTTSELRAALDAAITQGETPVAEIRYLYATDDDLLYQPVFVRTRTDKAPADCLLAQLVRTDRSGVAEI